MSSASSIEQLPAPSAFGAASAARDVIAGHDLTGRIVLLTGGASGIGIETARALAGAGAQVTLAVRNTGQGAAVAAELNQEVGAARVSVEALDLASLRSVRALADHWGERPLHLLINNAGVMACPQGYTEDGFETQFGVNHLGHFLLAELLTPALVRSAPSRLISLSSSAHKLGGMNFDDPHFRTLAYHPFAAYGQSKTANALFAVAFDRRYRGSGVRAFAVMPGVIDTPLMRHMSPEVRAKMMPKPDASAETKVRSRIKTPEQGAATTVWAAVATELDGLGGLYLEDCGVARSSPAGSPGGSGVMSYALDPVDAERLWRLSKVETCGTVMPRSTKV